MKEIKLTQGQVALVDDDDFERASAFKWFVQKVSYGFYAVRHKVTVEHGSYMYYLHYFILGRDQKQRNGLEIDHINGNPLDNRKENLRVCTVRQNRCNRRKLEGSASRYKGVFYDKTRGKWSASIRTAGITYNLGRFYDEVEAAKAYDRAAKEMFGAFARLNFTESDLDFHYALVKEKIINHLRSITPLSQMQGV